MIQIVINKVAYLRELFCKVYKVRNAGDLGVIVEIGPLVNHSSLTFIAAYRGSTHRMCKGRYYDAVHVALKLRNRGR